MRIGQNVWKSLLSDNQQWQWKWIQVILAQNVCGNENSDYQTVRSVDATDGRRNTKKSNYSYSASNTRFNQNCNNSNKNQFSFPSHLLIYQVQDLIFPQNFLKFCFPSGAAINRCVSWNPSCYLWFEAIVFLKETDLSGNLFLDRKAIKAFIYI